MILDILTPETQIFHGEVEFVSMPGLAGQFQVLKGHAAIISALKQGELRFKTNIDLSDQESLIKDQKSPQVYIYNLKGGVAEMLGDKVVVLAE